GVASHVNGQTPLNSAGDDRRPSQAAIDPLSQHILKRANTSPVPLLPKLRLSSGNPTISTLGSSGESFADGRHSPDHPLRSDAGGSGHKERKKGVSFLSRIIGNKKKDVLDDPSEAGSDQGDLRPEGMDAQLFSHPIDNISFNPRHPQPPAYIKIRSRNKKEKDFNRLFLAQELRRKTGNESGMRPSNGKTGSAGTAGSTEGTIWAMEFSKDGKYLAAAGQDKIVRVWAVLSTPEHRRAHEREEEAASGITEGQALRLSAPVFQSKPTREYEGHTSTVLDLSWSKNNFLLSSSMDKTTQSSGFGAFPTKA
ncbi:hypothetical protein LTR60_005966, partial [Cryomyces antarcticus]